MGDRQSAAPAVARFPLAAGVRPGGGRHQYQGMSRYEQLASRPITWVRPATYS